METPQGPGRPSRESLRIWVGSSTDLAELHRWVDALNGLIGVGNEQVTYNVDLRVEPLTYNLLLGPYPKDEAEAVLAALQFQGRTDAKLVA